MQAADKKRAKEEKDILHRLRPFARLQTAEDFEHFQADILCTSNAHDPIPHMTHYPHVDEHMLRKRIQELQHYRRMGLRTPADIEKYEADLVKRVSYSLPRTAGARRLIPPTRPTSNQTWPPATTTQNAGWVAAAHPAALIHVASAWTATTNEKRPPSSAPRASPGRGPLRGKCVRRSLPP